VQLVGLSFQSYKAFPGRESIEIRPLTVLIGRNNSGKSAVARLPFLLAGALSTSAVGPVPLEVDGLDFGESFRDLIHKRRTNGSIGLGATFEHEGKRFELRAGVQHHDDVKVQVVADPPSWRVLDQIVDRFFDERHRWEVDDPDAVEQSPWIVTEPQGSRASLRNLEALQRPFVDGLYAPSAYAHSRSQAHSILLSVCLVEAPPIMLSPVDALRALDMPVYVVVEDAESDKAFLLAMIRAHGRTTLQRAYESYWLEIEHAGGGGGIPKRVHDLLQKVGKGPRRIFVLSDSDRLVPDDPARTEPATKTIKMLGELRDVHDIPLAILRKREIENYLPIGALQRIGRAKQSVVRALHALLPEQRDFFDMKKGFDADERGQPIVRPEQEELFRHVPPRVRRDLVGGFGKNIWRYFESAADVVTRDAVRLTCPDCPDEIEQILDAIERLL